MSLKLDAPFYSAEELKLVDKSKLPKHIAIIPDGNGRWAASHFLPTEKGHLKGADGVVTISLAAKELGVKILTLFGFSTENWKREPKETEHLMKIAESYLALYREKLVQKNIRFNAIGRLDTLPESLQKALQLTIERTRSCHEFDLVVALNYGGRDELVRAVASMIAEKLTASQITEKTISEHLDTKNWPDPDLVIRTSGEKRISNFLLWQSSYSEIFIDNVAWPDFTPKHLLGAMCDYTLRKRRLGGRSGDEKSAI
jgi:undecaprenyl diphosphate synthase